jgi:hypothetical protein
LLTTALQHAVQPLLDICLGLKTHPAVSHYIDWVRSIPEDDELDEYSHPLQNDGDYTRAHPLPITPADEEHQTLAMTWLLQGLNHLRPERDITLMEWAHYIPMLVLTGLVIVRVRLGRPASGNLELWHMWKDRRIKRVWSEYEIAAASYLNDSDNDFLALDSSEVLEENLGMNEIKVAYSNLHHLPDGFSFYRLDPHPDALDAPFVNDDGLFGAIP